MKNANHRILTAGILLMLGWLPLLTSLPASGQTILAPAEPTPAMSVDDVRIGMKGYGLTVFHGTKIEPFNVEVVSIVPNAVPTRSVVWMRCTDDRMIESGPVQGMSGSPIFLWDDEGPHEIGHGGKLIGAFAFGYSESQQCIVGVQPIEYMRDSATRIPEADDKDSKSSTRSGSNRRAIESLQRMDSFPASSIAKTRYHAMLEMMRRIEGNTVEVSADTDRVPGPQAGTYASNMMLPITLGSSQSVELFSTLLEPMGLMAVASASGPVAGAPPKSIDYKKVNIQPGSVLAVPLAYGDMELSATGTVTDVLPDGSVLGFGHPMFDQGKAQVPMSTGYVHFVMPRRSISFKNSGSLMPIGSLVRDETAGVVGISDVRYTTAPVEVTINSPNDESRNYHYTVVNEPSLSPVLVANVVLESVNAIYGMNQETTMRVKGKLSFSGGRNLSIDSMIAGGNAVYAVMEVLPAVNILVDNAYESLDIESVNVTVNVEDGIQQARISNARLERAEVAPGDTVVVHLELQYYGGRFETRRIELTLPEDLEEGDYPLTVSGPDAYANMKILTKPSLMVTNTIDDIVAFIQETLSYKADAIYAALQLPDTGIAVGKTEMPKLPSSRVAMLTSPTTTETMTYPRLIDQVYDADAVILGQVSFTISVRKP